MTRALAVFPARCFVATDISNYQYFDSIRHMVKQVPTQPVLQVAPSSSTHVCPQLMQRGVARSASTLYSDVKNSFPSCTVAARPNALLHWHPPKMGYCG